MKANEFLDEVMQSDICPNNFKEIYNKFQIFQRDALDTLKEFHRVCEINKIPYQLSYGSLLGVIRDGGQIPWDYDIDVIVAYEDKNDLVCALNNDLGKEFYFYCPDNNPKCRHMIMRLAPVSYRTEALHVDVFFLTGTPVDKDERRVFINRIKEISDIRFNRLVNIFEESLGNPRIFASLLLKKKILS